MKLWWADEDAKYIRHRSARYPGAVDIDPEWTQEVLADDRMVEPASGRDLVTYWEAMANGEET